jgi:hypothetical protein
MGELLDRLSQLDSRPHAPGEPIKSLADQVMGVFQSADESVSETIEAVQGRGMPFDTLSRWARRAPLQALAVAFLTGVIVARRPSNG